MNKPCTIGVDIGATKLAVGLVRGNRVEKREVKIYNSSDKSSTKSFLNAIRTGIQSVWKKDVKGIGLGLAGSTDPARSIFLEGVNFPHSFRNVNLSVALKDFGCPVRIDNDVRAFTLGEALYGAGRGHQTVFGLTLGTGIGGALVNDGRVWPGRNNGAGEVGHLIIQMDGGEKCSDGHFGHFEAYASGQSLQRQIKKLIGSNATPKDLNRLVKEGDRRAEEIVARAGRAVAVGLANIIQTINPDIIVVGGSLTGIQSLWRDAKSRYKELITYRLPRTTPVVKSKLGHDAAILGAAELVRHN